jgi:hypothetical protein
MTLDVGATFTLSIASVTSAVTARAALIDTPDQEIDDFDSIVATFNLYDGDSIKFTTRATSVTAPYVQGYASDVWLFNQLDTTRTDHMVQRYRVLPPEQDMDADGKNVVTVNAVCYKQLLKTRLLRSVPGPFVNVDESQIVKAIVDHLQAQGPVNSGYNVGNLRIDVTALANTGRTRTRTEYKVGDNAYSIIDDLSKVINGPTWRVAPTTVWDRSLLVKDPSTYATIDQPIVQGDNALALKRPAVSTVATSGFCPGTNSTSFAFADSATLATDPRGLLEVSRSASTSVVNQSQVLEVAQGVLEDFSTPASVWTVQMDVARWLTDSRYLPGTFTTIKEVPNLVSGPSFPEAGVTRTVRVTEVKLTLTANGQATVELAAVEL